MIRSRLSRLETKKEKRRLSLAIGGILAIIILVPLFGVKALIGFSVFVDSLRGGSPASTVQNQVVLLPPTLDPPAVATNTATISVSGKGQANNTLIVYLNNSEFKKQSIPTDGAFTINDVPLSDGPNTISAKLTDEKGNTSDLSNVVSVTYANTPPKLDITGPEDNTTTNGDPNTVAVTGATDDNITVTINDRFVVVKSDDTFSYSYPLNEGDNILNILAVDAAGNQTKVTRKVTYHR